MVGPVPAGLLVCHRCDNPPCVNPAHLFLGTQGTNMRDAWRKGRFPLGEDRPKAKLRERQVVMIRCIHDEMEIHPVELARLYGVDEKTMRDIVRRRTWRHVP